MKQTKRVKETVIENYIKDELIAEIDSIPDEEFKDPAKIEPKGKAISFKDFLADMDARDKTLAEKFAKEGLIQIEIGVDCRPLVPRPDVYLPSVLKDTGIEIDPNKTTSRLFGAWTWHTTIPKEQWTDELYSLIWNRLNNLHKKGAIRGAILNPKPK